MSKDVLPKLATNATLSVLDKFKKEISDQGAVRAGKEFTLLIANKDMYDGASETVKYEINKQEGGFHPAMIASMAALLIAPIASY